MEIANNFTGVERLCRPRAGHTLPSTVDQPPYCLFTPFGIRPELKYREIISILPKKNYICGRYTTKIRKI